MPDFANAGLKPAAQAFVGDPTSFCVSQRHRRTDRFALLS